MASFDAAIADRVPAINDRINTLNQAVAAGEGVHDALDDLLKALNELNEQFDQRDAAIHEAGLVTLDTPSSLSEEMPASLDAAPDEPAATS